MFKMWWSRLSGRDTRIEFLVYASLFLFPIFGMLIRGWLTNIYNFLFLLGLYYLNKRKNQLAREEKIFIVICTIYVAVFLLSALVNGWGKQQTYYLGTELRFLFIIPIYLLVREYSDSWIWLLRGSIAAIFVIFIQSLYEVYVLHVEAVYGVYSKNLIGPFAILMAFWILHLWQGTTIGMRNVLIILSCLMAVFATITSGSRGAYVGFVIMLIVSIVIKLSKKLFIPIILLASVIGILLYQQVDMVRQGIDKAVQEYQEYFEIDNILSLPSPLQPVVARLEMWRAAKYIVADHPVFGIGPGNYQTVARGYVAQGKVHKDVGEHGHPHNAYLESLISKGIVGLITLMLLLYYPLYVFIKTSKYSAVSGSLGMIHIVGITAFMITDASPILMNNYTSIVLLGMAVFFSHHLNQVRLASNISDSESVLRHSKKV